MDESRMNGVSISVHPGVVRTERVRRMEESIFFRLVSLATVPLQDLLFKSPMEGEQTSLYATLEDEDKLKKGHYYKDCRSAKIQNKGGNYPEEAKKFWKLNSKSNDPIIQSFNPISIFVFVSFHISVCIVHCPLPMPS